MSLMVDERESSESSPVVDRSEGFGERLLGSLIDRAHRILMDPPRPIDGSLAGQAFQTDVTIEETQSDGVRLFVPCLTEPIAWACSSSHSTPSMSMTGG